MDYLDVYIEAIIRNIAEEIGNEGVRAFVFLLLLSFFPPAYHGFLFTINLVEARGVQLLLTPVKKWTEWTV